MVYRRLRDFMRIILLFLLVKLSGSIVLASDLSELINRQKENEMAFMGYFNRFNEPDCAMSLEEISSAYLLIKENRWFFNRYVYRFFLKAYFYEKNKERKDEIRRILLILDERERELGIGLVDYVRMMDVNQMKNNDMKHDASPLPKDKLSEKRRLLLVDRFHYAEIHESLIDLVERPDFEKKYLNLQAHEEAEINASSEEGG